MQDALAVMRKVDRNGLPVPFVLEYDPYNVDKRAVGARRSVKAVMHWSNKTHTKAYSAADVSKAVDGLKNPPKRIINKFEKGLITIQVLDNDAGNDIRFVHTMCMVRLNQQLIKLHIHG